MNKHDLPDANQNYFQLTAIQLTSWISIPTLATSILVLQVNSFLGAALTIIVGNAILWFIRLGIAAMSHEKKLSTLDLSQKYLGSIGSYSVAGLLLTSTIVWFLIQTTAAGNALTQLVSLHENPSINQFIQISVALGLASTLLCIEGMVLLRWLSSISFPILFLALLVILFLMPKDSYHNNNPLSLAGLSLVLATNLGISADIPTFFRHSRSWVDTLKALALTQVFSLILGLAGLYLGSMISGMFDLNLSLISPHDHSILRYALILFIFLSTVCANVANVYSTSVGWELIAPKALIGRQEYLILGSGLTLLYIFLGNVFSPSSLLAISDNALVNLSLILLLAYMITKSQKSALSHPQQLTYLTAWITSTVLNSIQLCYNPFDLSSITVAMGSTLTVISIGSGISQLLRKGRS
jgi:purine-cytosine permease-like protein